jgi:hypothetical protein
MTVAISSIFGSVTKFILLAVAMQQDIAWVLINCRSPNDIALSYRVLKLWHMKNSPKDENSKDKRCNCDLTKNCVSSIFQGRTMKRDFYPKDSDVSMHLRYTDRI